MVEAFGVVGIIFLLVMIYLTYVEYKKSRLTQSTFAVWLFFWLLAILLVIFQPYVNSIISDINIVRVLDLYMILGFMFLFAVIFYLFVIVKNAEKRVEEVVRKVALMNIKKK